ncbi:MAG: hypothetical protein COS85_13510 [Armatimonadetes bacterium CG07_land_8_20_14_0_80_59_28]|nr:MAG: hypothetical protein COS85_13510 [Armatimonadetes bacterium CG07_land_8_20_14_0_80_59_28]PIX40878.1 MAG: hypothetical protein COZ56_13565 [Armatimonadetes bacterium CG_4_8_14_3_um_filter_58_9]PJB75238.1 MAG: hypothetical protein CO095_03975 [Armatimonadetes bacterium CG_4_9_14_3_um_filter_58_7]
MSTYTKFTLICLFWLPGPASAQTDEALSVPGLIQRLVKQSAGIGNLSGVLHRSETTTVGNERWEDRFVFSAPDRFRSDSARTAGEGTTERTAFISHGNESWMVSPDTDVARHWSRNLFLDWVELVGGPANVGAFLTDASSIQQLYSISLLPKRSPEPGVACAIELLEKEPRAPLLRDIVRSGGTFPLMEYMVYKQPRYLKPPTVRLYFDGQLRLTRREHLDENGRIVFKAECVGYVSVGAYTFPAIWEVRNRFDAVVTRVEYRELQANVPALNATFDPRISSRMVLEEQEPRTVEEWRRRVGSDPEDADAPFNLATTLLRHLEDVPAALQSLNTVIRLRPQAVAPWALAAEVYVGSSDLDNALVACEQALKLSPGHPQVRELTAQVLIRMNRLNDAVECLKEGLAKDSRNAHWHVLLGEAYQRLGRYEEAASAYRKVIQAEGVDASTPDQLAAAENLLNLTRWTGMDMGLAGTNPFSMKCVADDRVRAGRAPEGIQGYERAVQTSPQNGLLKVAIACALLRQGQLNQAGNLLQQVADEYPEADIARGARRALVGISIEQGEFGKAWAQFQSVMEKVDGQREGNRERRLFLESFQKRFKHDELVQFLEAKVSAGSADENIFRLLADLYLWEGDRSRTIAILRAGSYKHPDKAVLKSLLVDQLVAEARAAPRDSRDRQRKFAEAQREAERLVRMDPSQPYFQTQLAFLLQFQGTRGAFSQALTTAQELVKRHPDDPDAYATLATVHLNRAWEASSALVNYQKALEMGLSYQERHEEVFYIRQGIGAVHQQGGSLEKVLQEYQRLLSRCPDASERVSLYSALMVILSRSQRMDLALDYLHSLLNTDASGDEKRLVINFVFSSLGKKKEFDDSIREHIGARMAATPEDPCWILFDAIFKLSLGERSAGLMGYEKAASLTVSDAVVAEWLADWHYSLRDYASAARHYERVLSLDPRNTGAHIRLAVCYFRTGQVDRPVELARQMMLRMPNNVDEFIALGSLYRATGRTKEASAAFLEASRLCRLDVDVNLEKTMSVEFDLAGALVASGDHDQAEVVLKRLTLRQCGIRNRIAAYRALASAYVIQKRRDDAIDALNDAVELVPAPDTGVRKALEEEIGAIRNPNGG